MGAMSATRRWSRRKALSLVLVGLLVLSSSCALVVRAEDEDYEEGGSGDGYVSPQKDSGDFAGDLADAIEQQEFREEAESSDDEGRRKVVPEPGPWSLADYYPESEASEEETVEAKEGFEAMLAASEKARKQLQLR